VKNENYPYPNSNPNPNVKLRLSRDPKRKILRIISWQEALQFLFYLPKKNIQKVSKSNKDLLSNAFNKKQLLSIRMADMEELILSSTDNWSVELLQWIINNDIKIVNSKFMIDNNHLTADELYAFYNSSQKDI
jgi:hypothetical protein